MIPEIHFFARAVGSQIRVPAETLAHKHIYQPQPICGEERNEIFFFHGLIRQCVEMREAFNNHRL